jgi:hypothetical protein
VGIVGKMDRAIRCRHNMGTIRGFQVAVSWASNIGGVHESSKKKESAARVRKGYNFLYLKLVQIRISLH